MNFWRRLIRITDAAVTLLMLLFLLPLLSYGIYALWDTQQIYKSAACSLYQDARPSSEECTSFIELQERNPEVIGWLKIDGTGIDYPLLQADNNTKYVNTNATGSFSLSGSLFLDCRNNPAFTDVVHVIYGHHMEQDVMFGGLDAFASQAYFDAHPCGALFYGGAWHQIDFFAFAAADAYDPIFFHSQSSDPDEGQYYLDYVYAHALQSRPQSFPPDGPFVALSTCADTSTNGRHLLIGRICEAAPPE